MSGAASDTTALLKQALELHRAGRYHGNLGNVLKDARQTSGAVAAYRRVLEIASRRRAQHGMPWSLAIAARHGPLRDVSVVIIGPIY